MQQLKFSNTTSNWNSLYGINCYNHFEKYLVSSTKVEFIPYTLTQKFHNHTFTKRCEKCS